MGDHSYRTFGQLDGTHPLRKRVPDGFVDYRARTIRGTEVVYFNFALAREMGLIHRSHRDRMTPDLTAAILDTFALQIINEHDQHLGIEVSDDERKPGRYMATRSCRRYLPFGWANMIQALLEPIDAACHHRTVPVEASRRRRFEWSAPRQRSGPTCRPAPGSPR